MALSGWHESDEIGLVIAAQAGDLHAFDRLAQRYRPAAVTIARQLLPHEAAEDAAQDALLAAFKAVPQLEDPSRFSAWLGTIVRNRARKLGLQRSKEPLPLDRVILAYAPSVLAQVESGDVANELRCAIAALPADVREAVDLHHLQGWTAVETATFLGLPLSTVKWRLHTGRRLLRSRLAFLEDEL